MKRSKFLILNTMLVGLMIFTSCSNDNDDDVGNITPKPLITSFSPDEGLAGTEVTVIGENFDGASVTLGSTAVTLKSITASQFKFDVPEEASTGKISVATDGGTATSGSDFTVLNLPVPAVSEISKLNGFYEGWIALGDSIVITGSNFTDVTSVTLGGEEQTIREITDDTQIIIDVTESAKSGALEVMAPGGTATVNNQEVVKVYVVSWFDTPHPRGEIALTDESKSTGPLWVTRDDRAGFADGYVNLFLNPHFIRSYESGRAEVQFDTDIAGTEGANGFLVYSRSPGSELDNGVNLGKPHLGNIVRDMDGNGTIDASGDGHPQFTTQITDFTKCTLRWRMLNAEGSDLRFALPYIKTIDGVRYVSDANIEFGQYDAGWSEYTLPFANCISNDGNNNILSTIDRDDQFLFSEIAFEMFGQNASEKDAASQVGTSYFDYIIITEKVD